MPVELTIAETEVVLDSVSAPGPAGPGVPIGGTTGQILAKNSNTDYDTEWVDETGGGGGGSDDQTAAEVPFTPAGNIAATDVQAAIAELDSEKASQTAFADHSARHENGGADEISVAGLSGLLADGQTPLAHVHDGGDITTGTVADARIASTIARDAEVTAAVAAEAAARDAAIAAAIAIEDGAGLSDNGAGVLSVNVDGSTIEINADALRVKADGITANEIAANAVGASELGDNAVDTNAIAANAVTAAKVAADVATQAELDAVAAAAQPLDSDLTTIAAIAPANDDVIQRKTGAWTNRTIAQLLVDLAAPGTTFQPLDSDLTAIAALATTSFGRGLLELANAAALATAAGLGTGDSPQFTAINLGHASDTTITRTAAGAIAVEGNTIYRAGGTDVPLADGGTGASLADPNADRIMFWDDSAGAIEWLTAGTGLSIAGTSITATASGGLHTAYAVVRDEKSSGTDGGTFTSGSWQTRTLNTELFDPGSIVSLSSNQFTLAAGTYYLRARAPAIRCSSHKLKFRDITNSADLVVGETMYANEGVNDCNNAFVEGRVTLAGTTAIELQHRCASTQNTYGLGLACAFSVVEVYAVVEIWKEA